MLVGKTQSTYSNTQAIAHQQQKIRESTNELPRFVVDESKFSINDNKSTDFTDIEYGNNSISLATPELLAKFGAQINPWVAISHTAFKEIVKDPAGVVEAEKSNYKEFLSEANVIIEELKKLDKTHMLDVKIDTAGFVEISMNESKRSANPYFSGDEVDRSRKKMKKWVSENEELIREKSLLGRKYALAKSVQAYETATGINHTNLHTIKPRIIEGSPSEFIAQAREDSKREIEYLSKMGRYASWKFATTPLSYEAIDNMGHPANAPGSEGQSAILLPSMNGDTL